MADAAQTYEAGQHPDLPPPRSEVGVLGWVKHNLFSSPLNAALTILAVWFLWMLLPPLIDWMFLDAVWTADSRKECWAKMEEPEGAACWAFIKGRFQLFVYGFYPHDSRWRVNLSFVLLVMAIVPVLYDKMPGRKFGLWYAMAFPFLAGWLLVGGMETITGLLILAAVEALIGAVLVQLVCKMVFGFSPSYSTVYLANLIGNIAYIVVGNLLAYVIGLILAIVESVFGISLAMVVAIIPFISIISGFFLYAAIFGISISHPEFGPMGIRRAWQLALSAWIVATLIGLVMGIFGDLVFDASAYWNYFGLKVIDTDQFGGILLTLVIGVTGISFSLPIGVLLALGRRSSMPVLRILCVLFIEFIRGVPLIALLFIASSMLNFFLPPGTSFDLLLRVLIMVTLFSAAYIAEVVRGGLQAIPRGQIEAADSLGLTYVKAQALIVLPQALKISIPGIVNTFIGLFKDTTLVLIIGMLDPLGIGRASLADAAWSGLSREVYLFVALFFFICCFSMSRYSLYLEKKLHTGH